MDIGKRYQAVLLFVLAIVIAVAPASAQWVKVPPLPVPAGPDGKTEFDRASAAGVRRPPGSLGHLGDGLNRSI
jgi:hypothetical protein